ncbi:hypothetical protein [Modestobacter roseus]|uniref:hypothetical protein n=1 Tax=Modestobacter roseus TaxID=1181884 RepID=UPI001296B335|nr:hypothetical protein [Modestobacter roseus]
MHEEPRAAASPFYAVGRLWAALQTAATSGDEATRARATAKVDRWRAVLDGMASGELTIGSRTPVVDTPAWVTLEVVTGGFATGRYLAEQPLDDDERAKLAELPPGPGSTPRERLNLWYLSDAGQAELLSALVSEQYRIGLPEHAALAVVALLVDRGHGEAALDLVAALRPYLHRLRFTPQLTDRSMPTGTAVHLEPVGRVAATLRAATPPAQLIAMRETLTLWHPLYDDLVALWAETVDGELPHLVTSKGAVSVEGGWPARRFPDGWAARRTEWLSRCAATVDQATASSRHQHPKSNFTRLRRALELAGNDGAGLSGRDVGWVRRTLANTVTRHGAPGSEARAALRAVQAVIAGRPTHAALAHVVAGRLDRFPADGGLPALDPVVGDIADAEAPAIGDGVAVPASVVRTVSRALEAPVEELIERGVIGSGEVLARVLPQVTAQYVSASIDDAVIAGLYARTYTAFRRRRSLLLLNLKHQVRFEELPWVAALSGFRAQGHSTHAARQALHRAVRLALDSFPERILPNPLVREFGALATAADVRLALVEEVAADIFMGTFTTKWRTAAKVASESLQGSLYARYYDLPDPEFWASTPEPNGWARRLQRRWGKETATDFTALCNGRAAEAGRDGHSWSVAANGAVLEQSQILTTHNLAVLTVGLDLESAVRERAPELAERVLTWVLQTHAHLPSQHHAALQAVKNISYAWRQALYLLSYCDHEAQVATMNHLLEATATGTARQLRPVVNGLVHVLAGGRFDTAGIADGGTGRRLLGWSVGQHWLLGRIAAPR